MVRYLMLLLVAQSRGFLPRFSQVRKFSIISKSTSLFGEVQMPAMSSTMKEGRVVEWLKSEGEPITAGESIATIESDKVRHTMQCMQCLLHAQLPLNPFHFC